MSTRFFTDDGENTLLNKFAGVFAHNPNVERFDTLVGYLRSCGYFALIPHLKNVPQLRMLVRIEPALQALESDWPVAPPIGRG